MKLFQSTSYGLQVYYLQAHLVLKVVLFQSAQNLASKHQFVTL